MKKQSLFLGAVLAVFVCAGCATTESKLERRELAAIKAEQAAATPAQVLAALQRGNARYVAETPVPRDLPHDRRITTAGQYPQAVVLSCMDSRVPPERIFDAGLGELLCVRIAGYSADADLVGSLEYACAVAGAKILLVMGHTHCGAIKGALDHVELGNLTGLLQKIDPAIAAVHDVPGARSSKNNDFVEAVGEAHVQLTLARIRELSPVLRDLERAGKIQLVGCSYDIESGRVRWLPPAP